MNKKPHYSADQLRALIGMSTSTTVRFGPKRPPAQGSASGPKVPPFMGSATGPKLPPMFSGSLIRGPKRPPQLGR